MTFLSNGQVDVFIKITIHYLEHSEVFRFCSCNKQFRELFLKHAIAETHWNVDHVQSKLVALHVKDIYTWDWDKLGRLKQFSMPNVRKLFASVYYMAANLDILTNFPHLRELELTATSKRAKIVLSDLTQFTPNLIHLEITNFQLLGPNINWPTTLTKLYFGSSVYAHFDFQWPVNLIDLRLFDFHLIRQFPNLPTTLKYLEIRYDTSPIIVKHIPLSVTKLVFLSLDHWPNLQGLTNLTELDIDCQEPPKKNCMPTNLESLVWCGCKHKVEPSLLTCIQSLKWVCLIDIENANEIESLIMH